MDKITPVLEAIRNGENGAAETLLPLVYQELRHLARARMAGEAAGHTLQPTALVHEAWLRLTQAGERDWKNRAYFFAAAAQAMRRILVDHARRKAHLKHGGGQVRLTLEDVSLAEPTPDEKVLLVNEALEELEAENPERAQIVVLKYFSGLTNKEVAEALGIGERTVDRHWVCAKSWLFRRIRAQV